jgi:hypothetical protein
MLLSKVVMGLAPPSNSDGAAAGSVGTSQGTTSRSSSQTLVLGSSRSSPDPHTVPLITLSEAPLSSSFASVPVVTSRGPEDKRKSLVLGGTFSAGASTAGAGNYLKFLFFFIFK